MNNEHWQHDIPSLFHSLNQKQAVLRRQCWSVVASFFLWMPDCQSWATIMIIRNRERERGVNSQRNCMPLPSDEKWKGNKRLSRMRQDIARSDIDKWIKIHPQSWMSVSNDYTTLTSRQRGQSTEKRTIQQFHISIPYFLSIIQQKARWAINLGLEFSISRYQITPEMSEFRAHLSCQNAQKLSSFDSQVLRIH